MQLKSMALIGMLCHFHSLNRDNRVEEIMDILKLSDEVFADKEEFEHFVGHVPGMFHYSVILYYIVMTRGFYDESPWLNHEGLCNLQQECQIRMKANILLLSLAIDRILLLEIENKLETAASFLNHIFLAFKP